MLQPNSKAWGFCCYRPPKELPTWEPNTMEGIKGKLFICSAEDLKIKVGSPCPLLKHDFSRLQKAVTPCWLMSTWKFIYKGKIKVEDDLMDILT